MPEHHDLRVFGRLVAAEQHQPAGGPDHDQVEKAKGHEPRSCQNPPTWPNRRSQDPLRVLKRYRSPALFADITAAGFDLLTWRKGPAPDIGADAFTTITCADDRGREHAYDLADTTITLTISEGPRKGQAVSLRQVTRRVPARSGGTRQIHALTSRTDLAAGELCWRLTSRWREENYFRYARTHFALDALDSHAATPDDPGRKVPNPARKAAAAQVRRAEVLAAAAGAQRDASLAALRNPPPGQPVTITNRMINALDTPVEAAWAGTPSRPGRRGGSPRPHPPWRDSPGHGPPGGRGQADHPRHPDGRL